MTRRQARESSWRIISISTRYLSHSIPSEAKQVPILGTRYLSLVPILVHGKFWNDGLSSIALATFPEVFSYVCFLIHFHKLSIGVSTLVADSPYLIINWAPIGSLFLSSHVPYNFAFNALSLLLGLVFHQWHWHGVNFLPCCRSSHWSQDDAACCQVGVPHQID